MLYIYTMKKSTIFRGKKQSKGEGRIDLVQEEKRKNIMTGKKQEKQNKKQVEGQFDMYNYKLAEIAHEVDKINLNELTPIDALNTLVRIKEKMK